MITNEATTLKKLCRWCCIYYNYIFKCHQIFNYRAFLFKYTCKYTFRVSRPKFHLLCLLYLKFKWECKPLLDNLLTYTKLLILDLLFYTPISLILTQMASLESCFGNLNLNSSTSSNNSSHS